MNRNDINYVMIKSVVEKGIRDIQENPGRGIRGLVDLGGMFADGRFQKEFFDAAFTELENEDSMYYQLVERVVVSTDPRILTGFGMNLGYNSWTVGARSIREIEDKNGFNIPWCLLLDMGYGQYLELDIIRSLIGQGKELGIYTYLLYVERDYPCWDSLLALIREEKDCAFIFFLHPGVITERFADELLSAQTIWANIDLDTDEPEQIKTAVKLLAKNRCLCGGFSRYTDWDREAIPCLSTADNLNLPFLFLIGAKKHHLGIPDGEDKLINLRGTLPLPVFPIELYRDMAQIDRNISTDVCLTAILGDGSVFTTDAENMEVQTRYNIKDTSLRDILAKTMPKKRDATPA